MEEKTTVQNTEWPNKDNLDKLELKEAEFLFSQAEKQLKETGDIGNLVVTRATTLITLVSGLLIGIIGYAFSRWQTSSYVDNIMYTCGFVALYLCLIILLLAVNILGKDYRIIGSEPKSLFVDTFFKGLVPESKRIIHFYVSESINYQGRIEKNKKTNETRWKLFNTSLIMVITTPITIPLIYLIVTHCR